MVTNKRVLTIQDISCLGQCSITVALPIISACGIETVIMPSALLSTHTGEFKGFTFKDLTDELPLIMNHWISEGQTFDCLYTGYLGSIKEIEFVKEVMDKVLKEGAIKIIDPAMADFGKLYSGFDDEYVKKMTQLCSDADIILPNLTEAALMTGTEYKADNHSMEYVKELLGALKKLGSKIVILKGISFEEDKIGIAVFNCETEETKFYFTKKIAKGSHGTGDCYAAAFTGAVMQGFSYYDAAALAADFVVECIEKTTDDKDHWYGVKFEQAIPMLVRRVYE